MNFKIKPGVSEQKITVAAVLSTIIQMNNLLFNQDQCPDHKRADIYIILPFPVLC